MSKFVVTITPPTPNGGLHIGHIAGPFLSADIFKRTQELMGHECVLLCYSDDYQSYMLRKGIELEKDPMEIARENTGKIKTALSLANISIDHWHVPYENNFFRDAVQECYDCVAQNGAIMKRTSTEPYCPSCNVWGYEAFGRGDCNYCGIDSDASQCEGCALEPVSKEMENFRCKLCGNKHEWKDVAREFLLLQNFEDKLAKVSKSQKFRQPLPEWLESTLKTQLKDWGITRPHDGGLDLLEDGTRRIHTWFMGLAGYLAAFREWAHINGKENNSFDDYWNNPNSRLVHFLGFDCVLSHVIVYPCIHASSPNMTAKQIFYTNQFLTLDGKNLSTSRNHVLWVDDLVRDYCSDSVRLYSAIISPEEREDDFRVEDFKAWRSQVFWTFSELELKAWKPDFCHQIVSSAAENEIVKEALTKWWAASQPERFSAKQMAEAVDLLLKEVLEESQNSRMQSSVYALVGPLVAPFCPELSDRISNKTGLPPEVLISAIGEITNSK